MSSPGVTHLQIIFHSVWLQYNMANLFRLWASILSFLPPDRPPTSSALKSYQTLITFATCSTQLYGVAVGFTSGLRRFLPQVPIHKTVPGHFPANSDESRDSCGSHFMYKTSLHSELLFSLSSSKRVYSELPIATYGLWRKAQNSQSQLPWVLPSYFANPPPPLARVAPCHLTAARC